MNQFDDVGFAIEALRSGEMILIVDDHDRENEGDLVVAAEFATSEVINFMSLRGRGLICVALDASFAGRLGLEPMVRETEDDLGTAFTVSVDGAPTFGVTTGISARDRATTIQVILDPAHGPDTLRRPGHMFPLIAHPHGVLGRRGHTEASTDLCEMAGLEKAAVIVEILRPDGEMARETELNRFARRHGLVKVSVEDIARAQLSSGRFEPETATASR
ncbi:3,4-dihydroxy-2-butanone-4-phosphate synthase [Diaminobutyricibacter sp. McL0618]|uniref:3,4-dihydroxy-2-butanone-4-phosphate synthase n=1 Tax=Leifsonia sp. McL0618 TaxID=3415677 RepID=UPI003CF3A38B